MSCEEPLTPDQDGDDAGAKQTAKTVYYWLMFRMNTHSMKKRPLVAKKPFLFEKHHGKQLNPAAHLSYISQKLISRLNTRSLRSTLHPETMKISASAV